MLASATQQNLATDLAQPTGGTAKTIPGCLPYAGNRYVLIDPKSGMSYQFVANTDVLHREVGHKVQITGTLTNPTSGHGGNANEISRAGAGSPQAPPVIHPETVRERIDCR